MTALAEQIGSRQALINAILDEYWMASPTDITRGMVWYDLALTEACRLDRADGRQGAGVIAALSPLAPWGKNIERARLAFERGEAGGLTFGQHTRKADRILNGEDPLDVLGGNKVRSFFACILGSTHDVCIDRHAFDLTQRRHTNDKEKKVLDRKGVYLHVADAYVEAAQWAGLEPRQLQAITWTSWRRRKGVDRWADAQ